MQTISELLAHLYAEDVSVITEQFLIEKTNFKETGVIFGIVKAFMQPIITKPRGPGPTIRRRDPPSSDMLTTQTTYVCAL